jgi:hypothetical protein
MNCPRCQRPLSCAKEGAAQLDKCVSARVEGAVVHLVGAPGHDRGAGSQPRDGWKVQGWAETVLVGGVVKFTRDAQLTERWRNRLRIGILKRPRSIRGPGRSYRVRR